MFAFQTVTVQYPTMKFVILSCLISTVAAFTGAPLKTAVREMLFNLSLNRMTSLT